MSTNETSKKKQSVDNQIASEEYEYVTIPPDGGYGWVIAISAMLCNLVCDGTLFAFGAMKKHLQKKFDCSDMVILMVGAVPCGVYLLVGPIVSGLANRYGCRIIIIIGSIGAATCTVLSAFLTNAYAMMVIYGIFGGIFFGMIYLPSIVMVSFYFDKKRAIANGLVTAGTGIGALSFGLLADHLMDKYSPQTGLLIFAGILLSCILFGSIMKPLQPRKVPIKRTGIESQIQSKVKSDRSVILNHEMPDGTYAPLLTTNDDVINHNNLKNVPSFEASNLNIPSKQSRIRTLSGTSRTSTDSTGGHRVGVLDPENATRPLYRKDALFTGSKQQLHHLSRTSLNSDPYRSSIADVPPPITETQKKQSAYEAFIDILSAMIDVSILKNKHMLLICIGNIFTMLGYYLPIMCLISFAQEDLGVNEGDAPYLMTVFGFFNTIGRFAGGPIAMIPHFTASRVHNILLYVAGATTVLAAYANNFTTCAIYAGVCGFAFAPHMALLPSMICDSVGLDKYTTAYGVLGLFRGFASMVGPPAAGFVKDQFKKYEYAFIIGGTMIIIGAFFHFCLSLVKPEPKDNREKEVHV
ncbi:unnamed protein product [Adineta steineri]|uniref:Major facilitator superfamily (MFS) profile domain-containing protein n=1 Tax=Adineta steineri TaxID=433720 RepID=A0A819D4B9_9BILA|nr:unnamed protein product [Adineta steineri]